MIERKVIVKPGCVYELIFFVDICIHCCEGNNFIYVVHSLISI